MLAVGGGVAPFALAGDRLGIGVKKVLALVKDLACLRLIGAIHPVGVLKLLDVQLEDDHGVHVADPAALGEGEDREGLRLLPVEQQQLDRAGPVGVDGEIYAAGNGCGAVNLIEAGAHGEAVYIVQGCQVDGAGQGELLHRQRAFGIVSGQMGLLLDLHGSISSYHFT